MSQRILITGTSSGIVATTSKPLLARRSCSMS